MEVIMDQAHKDLKKISKLLSSRRHHSFAVIAVSAFFIFLVWFNLYLIFYPVKMEEVIVRIKPGDNTKVIARKLRDSRIIRSSLWFDLLARLTDSDRKLKAGRYVFGGNVNLAQTVIRIKEGRSNNLHLTIPEGFSLYRTVKQMNKAGIGSYDSLMAIATDPFVVKKLTGFEVSTLEGFLYPETYSFDIYIGPEQIFAMMTSEFFRRLKQAGLEVVDKDKFYKDLILASIVEQEAVLDEEKPLIAGVFLNRLSKNMKLESCPTVDYTLERQGIARKKLSYEDLHMNTPYNTYVISGLPPNPICNPSVSSIQAVIYPEVTGYLYFFADFKGRNVFSKTYSEHLARQKEQRFSARTGSG
jgi:UPF0755 protein